VDAIQLMALVAVLALADPLRSERPTGRRLPADTLLLSSLTALTILKPNVLLIAAAMALHVLVSRGSAALLAAALPAAVTAAVLALIPCWYFGVSTIWTDWYNYAFGAQSRIVELKVPDANYAMVAVISSLFGVKGFGVMSAIGSVLTLSFVAAIWRRTTGGTRGGSRLLSCFNVARQAARDPELVMSLAVVATLAVSPLVWVHYYVLSLIPALWLVGTGRGLDWNVVCATVSLLSTSGALSFLLIGVGWQNAVPIVFALSWIPLWIAILSRLDCRMSLPAYPHRPSDKVVTTD
jgi:hypothetical protein